MSKYVEEINYIPPFSLRRKEKQELFLKNLVSLSSHHYDNCYSYRRIVNILHPNYHKAEDLETIPFLPVRLFKSHTLKSVKDKDVFKVMHSSGTSGQATSKIYLDRDSAYVQTKVLSKIVSEFLGPKRIPMLVIDTKAVLKNRNVFSARAAGILGFSMFGRDVTFALDENMKIDAHALESFSNKYHDQPVFIFGFTFMVWQYFCKAIKDLESQTKFKDGIMLHGGGWKKLQQEAVDNSEFKKRLKDQFGIQKVHNYYGMVEQTGSVFVECQEGHLHCSNYSDIIIRDKYLRSCRKGEVGMIQLLSLLPHSYPGHSLLSEDLGEIIGEDDCECGKAGKYFIIHGRIKEAEVRGCSDTHSSV